MRTFLSGSRPCHFGVRLQGLLEFKDTHRAENGPIAPRYKPTAGSYGGVCPYFRLNPVDHDNLLLQRQLWSTSPRVITEAVGSFVLTPTAWGVAWSRLHLDNILASLKVVALPALLQTGVFTKSPNPKLLRQVAFQRWRGPGSFPKRPACSIKLLWLQWQ